MDRFEYASSKLEPGEYIAKSEKGVKLYDGDMKTTFERGDLALTNIRLMWAQTGDISRSLTCLSLPLHRIVFLEEEEKGRSTTTGFSFSKSRKLILHLAEPLRGKNLGPVAYSPNNFIKLSFKDDMSEFVIQLNSAVASLGQRAPPLPSSNCAQPSSNTSHPGIKLRTGIVGIERGIQERHRATDENITAAFKDLNRLMATANEMVNISKAISTKIREKQGDITEDETVRFKSYLLSLGISDPVTRDSFDTQDKFYQSLARQISSTMEQPITEAGGIMSLSDVYCRMNRARGLELLSPEDLLAACRLLAHLNLPVQLRQFDSGVRVLQLESHTDRAACQSTADIVLEKGSCSAELLAQEVGMSVLLAKERLLAAEKLGLLCRDDSIEGLRFYPNLLIRNN